MYDTKSNYAINKKDPDAIVYTDACEHVIRLTREDFDTESDFLRWKAWSDENYHDEEKREHKEANHTLLMEDVPNAVKTTDGPEIIIEHRIEKQDQERNYEETLIRIKGQLTEKQFRRVWMHCVDGLTQQEIAEKEKTSQSRISECVSLALKKVRRHFRVRQILPDIRKKY